MSAPLEGLCRASEGVPGNVRFRRREARPLFILQGGRDYQVTNTDFALWQKGLKSRKNCSLRLYPDLNHLFIPGS